MQYICSYQVKMATVKMFVLAFVILSHYGTPAIAEDSNVISVSSECALTNQTCLDDALDQLSNGITLELQPGHHVLARSHHQDTYGLSDVSIVGSGPQDTLVTCEDQVGLVFIGVENITLVNFTLVGCGLSGVNLNRSVALLVEVVDLWFLVPDLVRVALFIADSSTVVLESVTITNTSGLGLLGINILGNSELIGVEFTRNVRPWCIDTIPSLPSLISPEVYDQVGGGAYFLYADYHNTSKPVGAVSLTLDECYFAYNGDCTFAGNTAINFPFFENDGQALYEYAIGAGGGLSIVLANSHYGVNTNVRGTMFRRNDARYGGGAYVATFAGFQQPLSVNFFNCTFLENGMVSSELEGGLEQSYCNGGAGLAIFLDLIKPEHFGGVISRPEHNISVEVFWSKFIMNRAMIQGGGVLAYSLFNTPRLEWANPFFLSWHFSNTKFTKNSARYGSAGYFHQMATFSWAGTVILHMCDLEISENYQFTEGNIEAAASAIHMANLRSMFQGTSTLSNNFGSAIRFESSFAILVPQASIIFDNNYARFGGGVNILGINSGFILHNNTHLQFSNNEAIIEGGAVHYGLSFTPTDIIQPLNFFGCFIGTPAFYTANTNGDFGLFDSGITISFQNNTAPLGGIIYGTSLEACPWSWNISRAGNFTLYQALHTDYNSTFVFDVEPIGEKTISTLPSSICVDVSPDDDDITQPIQVFPGQIFNIRIYVLDFYDKSVPAVVTSIVTNDNVSAVSTLGSSGLWHTSVNPCPIQIAGMHRGIVNISITTVTQSLSYDFAVELMPCPVGFSIDLETEKCRCDELLLERNNLSCFSDSVSFKLLEGDWIGVDPIVEKPNTTDLIVANCVLNFCNIHDANVTPSDFDAQCSENREGLLCGVCAEGYSSVFGTPECRKCSNYWLFLIPAFAIAGAVLFAGIALLEITIDKGITHAIIFFVSVVFVYDFVSFNNVFYYFFLPARLISLQVGVSICFFDGMTPIHRSFLNFAFPAYLYLLIGIFTLLCRRYTWMSVNFSPAKTVVTVTALCYYNILTVCLQILFAVRIQTVGGDVYYRWFASPDQPYFRGLHGLLGAIAIFLSLFYLIPSPIMLLFPTYSYKYLSRLSIFFDIIWGAYKHKYRPWLGVRVLVVAFVFLSARAPPPASFLFNIFVIVIFANIQALLQPFKDKWANYADIIFLIIVTFSYWGAQLTANIELTLLFQIVGYIFVVCECIVAYSLMIALFILHMHRQFPNYTAKLRIKIMGRCKHKKPVNKTVELSQTVVSLDSDSDAALSANYQASETITETQETTLADSVVGRLPPSPTGFPRMMGSPHYRDSIFESGMF